MTFIPGSHHEGFGDEYGDILNSRDSTTYQKPASGRNAQPYDRSPNQPFAIPGAQALVAPAGACMVNWTMMWHTRPPSHALEDRKPPRYR